MCSILDPLPKFMFPYTANCEKGIFNVLCPQTCKFTELRGRNTLRKHT